MNNLPVEIVLKIVIKYKSLGEVKKFCSQSIRNSRICNINKNYICFHILKNNFKLLPYNLSTIILKQIMTIQKIYPEFPINITQKIAFKIIKLGYVDLLNICLLNKSICINTIFPYFAKYWSFVTTEYDIQCKIKIIQTIDNYKPEFINLIITKGWQNSIRTPTVKRCVLTIRAINQNHVSPDHMIYYG